MASLEKKFEILFQALDSLFLALEKQKEYSDFLQDDPKRFDEAIFVMLRDSVIQRFEYCVDLFWKMIKVHLQEVGKVALLVNTPKGVIREAVLARIISEKESDQAIDMINARNESSHIYKEEIAQIIAVKIPTFYAFMHAIACRLEKESLLQ